MLVVLIAGAARKVQVRLGLQDQGAEAPDPTQGKGDIRPQGADRGDGPGA